MAAVIEDEEFATSELAFLAVQAQSLAQLQLRLCLPIRPQLRQADAAIMAAEGASIFSLGKRLRSSKSLGLTGNETFLPSVVPSLNAFHRTLDSEVSFGRRDEWTWRSQRTLAHLGLSAGARRLARRYAQGTQCESGTTFDGVDAIG